MDHKKSNSSQTSGKKMDNQGKPVSGTQNTGSTNKTGGKKPGVSGSHTTAGQREESSGKHGKMEK